MNIQPTTYHDSRPSPSLPFPTPSKRLSATMKVRTFISKRLSQNFKSPSPYQTNLPSHHEERPITQFPRFTNNASKTSLRETTPTKPPSEMTGYLVQKHQAEKEVRKQVRVLQSANSSGNYLPLRSPIEHNPSTKTHSKEIAHFPNTTSLQSKSKPKPTSKNPFTNLVKQKIQRKPVPEAKSLYKGEEKGEREKGAGMAKIHNLRKAMQEGKLERVIPPPTSAVSSGQNRQPPPRPIHNPFLDHVSLASSGLGSKSISVSSQQQQAASKTTQIVSPRSSTQSRPRSRNRKTKSGSTGSRIVSLIGSSADILDSTRREIQEKFRPPFEYLNYPSFSLSVGNGKKDGQDEDADSEESFFCLGDREPGVLAGDGRVSGEVVERVEKKPMTRGKGGERGDSRIPDRDRGGDGKAWWDRGDVVDAAAVAVVKKCKLCGFGIASSMRGLCGDCEVDSVRLRHEISLEREKNRNDDSVWWDDDVAVKKCKLCRVGIISSMRGICGECESDSPRPQQETPAVEIKSTYSDSEYEDDIVAEPDTEEDDFPPALPLKIRKQFPSLPVPQTQQYDVVKPKNQFDFRDSDSDEDTKPPVPPKDDIDIVLGLSLPNRTYKPCITPYGPSPSRQDSQRAEIETEIENNMSNLSGSGGGWQNDGASPTYEEARKLLERWSECFGDGAVEGMRELADREVAGGRDNDGVPLVGKRDWDGVKRDSDFYRFWDEVLKEHAPKTPAMKARLSD
ncbi:hypothetical protein VTL71DRAFT_15095 [Oculimacula yallundae]|uniref:Uncharacterized protein n=1 Tax=Oculimacula yallundae TaxID=86028 RepID=A0ABR4CGD3_9HELO